MSENFDKKSPQPCMKYGEQMKHDFLSTPQRKPNRNFPSKGPAQQEHPNGNEQIILKKKGTGLIGTISCKGKPKFGTEKPANWNLR